MTSFPQTCEYHRYSVKLLLADYKIGLFILGLNLRRAMDVHLIATLIDLSKKYFFETVILP